MIQQRDKIRYGTITIPYYIIKSKRVKTSEIIVDANKVTIRTPLHKDKSEIQGIVLDKADWILRKQKEYRETIPQIIKPSFVENSTLPYLGRNYPLIILKEQEKTNIDLVDERFIINIKSSKGSSKLVKTLYENWLMDNAHHILKDKIEVYSHKLGVMTTRTSIKSLKNRWGSLTKDGVINININLLKAPEDIIDYMILHELCHLKIKEHSHHYWDLVRTHMPNYEEKVEWLKVNGDILL